MNASDVAVVAADVVAAAGLGWWFFGPKPMAEAAEAGGTQEVRVVVRGGYSPSRILARAGVPLRLVFDRQESGDCTSRVVFPDFGVPPICLPLRRPLSNSAPGLPASSALHAA